MPEWFQSRRKTVVIPVAIVFMAIAVFVFFKKTKPVQPPVAVQEKVWPVDVIEASYQTLSPVQTLYGKVESSSLVVASAPITAVVDRVWVKDGESVKKGQQLLRLDPKDMAIALQQAKADVADVEAQLALQRLSNEANHKRLEHEVNVLNLKREQVERTKQLIEKDLASQAGLDQVKEALSKQEYVVVGVKLAVEESQVRSAQIEARLEKVKAALAQARLNQKRGNVVAPYDARIASVTVTEGSRVNVGTAMLSFYGFGSLELRAKLPVNQVAAVQKALSEKQLLLAHYGSHNVYIELPLIRLAGESSTSGVDAFFALPETARFARPGDLLEVRLLGVPVKEVVAIPYSALYGLDLLYVLDKGRLQATKVQVVGEIERNGQLWALVKGESLTGSKVVTTHLPNAMTGLRVVEAER